MEFRAKPSDGLARTLSQYGTRTWWPAQQPCSAGTASDHLSAVMTSRAACHTSVGGKKLIRNLVDSLMPLGLSAGVQVPATTGRGAIS